jgi:hypothetical protein
MIEIEADKTGLPPWRLWLRLMLNAVIVLVLKYLLPFVAVVFITVATVKFALWALS